MPSSNSAQPLSGSFRLFQLAGISVYVHWTWFLVAFYELRYRSTYNSPAWNVVEYLALFFIVTLHEFGHAFACRQVGGRAERIVLWPLGGVAFVNPPPRPGAWLWSIAAGPLVNLFLLPVLFGVYLLGVSFGLAQASPDAAQFTQALAVINLGLLLFNLLPVYPLDGGQILQALLWFVIGRVWSLRIVSVIGLLVGVAVIGVAILIRDAWLGVVAVFVALQCWGGFRQAQALARLAELPRRADAACPSCGARALVGPFWKCDRCGNSFDTFEYLAMCPYCGKEHRTTTCPECQQASSIASWSRAGGPAAELPGDGDRGG